MASIGLWPARPRRMTLILWSSSGLSSSSSRRVPERKISRRVDALVADLAIEDEPPLLARCPELLENQVVHAAILSSRRAVAADGGRPGFFGVDGQRRRSCAGFRGAGSRRRRTWGASAATLGRC